MIKWETIETAPIDGSNVLLFAEKRIFEGFFMGGHWSPVFLAFHGTGCGLGDFPEPTHWAPLNYPEGMQKR